MASTEQQTYREGTSSRLAPTSRPGQTFQLPLAVAGELTLLLPIAQVLIAIAGGVSV